MTHYWFISKKSDQPAKLVLSACLLAFIVILLGAYTRLTNAGLSCPDWPHCYGFLTAPHTQSQLQNAAQHFPSAPVDTKKAWTEMTHRYFAGTEGILILLIAFKLLFRNTRKTVKSTIIACALIFLLSIQVTLGMLTVTEKLKPIIVLSHLLTGISLLSILWWAYLELPRPKSGVFLIRSQPLFWFILAVIIAAIQITLGGWVSTHYAGLACVDLPYCNGVLLPPLHFNQLNTDLISIHMLHRLGALVTAVYMLGFSLYLYFNARFTTLAKILFGLLCLQITLGVLNILWLRPIAIALLHQGVGILLLLTTLTALIHAAHRSALDVCYDR